jgi:twitching motility protein PilI
MSSKPNNGASREVSSPWLSPSEALTRFVPQGSEQDGKAQSDVLVRFGARVGDIGLLLPTGMLSEVVENTNIYPLPTTPPCFLGLINLRGSLIPTYNLKTLFEMPDQDVANCNLLVLNTGAAAVGIQIDGLPMTLDVSASMQQSPMLPPVLQGCCLAVYVQDGRVWVEFDFDGLFRAASNQNCG